MLERRLGKAGTGIADGQRHLPRAGALGGKRQPALRLISHGVDGVADQELEVVGFVQAEALTALLRQQRDRRKAGQSM